MEREPNRPTDDELIERGLQAWKERSFEGEIDDVTARIIASQYHEGQASGLYAFASSGAITLEAIQEAARKNTGTEDEWTFWVTDSLFRYFRHHGERGPVEGWHEATQW